MKNRQKQKGTCFSGLLKFCRLREVYFLPGILNLQLHNIGLNHNGKTDKMWSPKKNFHVSEEVPQLELRGDMPALSKSSKSGHVPQACKKET